MAKRFLPADRQWTQPNDGGGTLKGTFNVDFEADRGKVRVSKPVLQLFDENNSFSGAGEPFDRAANSILFFDNRYWAIGTDVF